MTPLRREREGCRPMEVVRRTTVYVKLLDEGTDVWRPVPAEDLGQRRYRLLPTDTYDPEDEAWEFPPGTVATCEARQLSDGVYLVAVHAA
jgi:hypothetical protein